MIEPSRLDFVCRFQDIQWMSFNLDCDKDISCSSLSSLYIPLLTLSGFDMSQSNGVYKLNNFEHMWREEKKHMMAFAYHFINSTVHTSKVIWALKTIEKLMNAFFTDEKRHGYMKQRLPLLAESWSTPTQGLRVTLWGGGVHIRHLTCTHRWSLTWPTRQRGQINMSDTAQSRLLEINGYRSILTNPLQIKQGLFFF